MKNMYFNEKLDSKPIPSPEDQRPTRCLLTVLALDFDLELSDNIQVLFPQDSRVSALWSKTIKDDFIF